MALTVGTNSYISVADATTYFGDRLNSSTWTDATEANKSAALIQATQIIETKKYLGDRYSTSQILSWPRYGVYVDNIQIDGSTVPTDILSAVCELAIYLLKEDYTEPSGLEEYKSIKIGSIELDMGATSVGVKQLPPLVNSILSKYADSSVRVYRA